MNHYQNSICTAIFRYNLNDLITVISMPTWTPSNSTATQKLQERFSSWIRETAASAAAAVPELKVNPDPACGFIYSWVHYLVFTGKSAEVHWSSLGCSKLCDNNICNKWKINGFCLFWKKKLFLFSRLSFKPPRKYCLNCLFIYLFQYCWIQIRQN